MNFLVFMIILSPFTALIPAVYGCVGIFKRNLKVKFNYWNIGFMALFLWAIFVAIINKSILSFAASLLLIIYFVISVVAQNYFVFRSRVHGVLKYVVKISTICGVLAVVEKAIMFAYGNITYRIYSTFGNPNMAGAWFASVFIISIYLRHKSKDRVEKRQLEVSLIIFLIAITLSGSRGAYCALIAAVIIYFLLVKEENPKRKLIFACSILVVAMVAIWSEVHVSKALITHDVSRSLTLREDIWRGSVRMFLSKPITGWGVLGTLLYGDELIPEYGSIIHSHNLWLTLLTSTGVVGLLIYLYMKFNLLKALVKLYNRNEPLVPLLVALNIMVIVQGIIDCTLYAPQLGILFACTGAIINNLELGKIKNKAHKIERIKAKSVAEQKVV